MTKKQTLIVFIFLCANLLGFGQINENIQTWTNRASYGSYTQTIAAGTVNMSRCIVANGAAGTGTCSIGRIQMEASNGVVQLPLLSSAETIEVHLAAGASGRSVKLQYYNGSTWTDLVTWTGIGTTGQTYIYNFNNPNPTQLRLASPSHPLYVHDILVSLSSLADDVDWCNVQWPSNDTIELSNTREVYARAWEAGVTDMVGLGAGLLCWIGYSSIDAAATFDFASPNWTWIPAAFNADTDGGANDEFVVDLGALIPNVGTYYYVSRFQLNGGPYRYGGYNAGGGGFWNGNYGSVPNDNETGQLIINARTPDWVNLQSPGGSNSITSGTPFFVYAQIYEPGITENSPTAPGANIQAWIGYSSTDNDPSISSGWTWIPAGHNTLCGTNCGFPTENNDEYFVDIGSSLPSGTYYYASRFTIDDPNVYYYGGWSGSGGGFWNNTYTSGTTADNVSGELIITPIPCNDLIISEYVEGSGNNKYLEIYNGTGATIDLSNYRIELYNNGSTTPNSTNILSGTLANGGTIVYKNSLATIYTGTATTLSATNFNGNDAIALVKIGTGTIIDVIGQIGNDPGDVNGWTGGSVSTVNRTLIRKSSVQYGDFNGSDTFDPNLEWNAFPIDYVSELGNHFSSCIPSAEIQLQIPTGSNVSCGYTYEFGSRSLNSNTDVILTIKNLGDLPLTISDLSFTDGSQYSLVSPPSIPFNIAATSQQNITIRFNPNAIGLFLDTLNITSNDASEGACSIDISGLSITNCSTTTQTIAHQDFELAVTDTWNYTPDHAPISGNWDVTTSLLPEISAAQNGSNFWGITDLERAGHTGQTHTLTFEQNISAYSNVELSFYYYTINLDAGDSLEYELFYDTVSQGIIDITSDTGAWMQIFHNIPDSVNDLKLVIYADIDAVNDKAGLDNFLLTSTSVNTTTWTSSGWSNGIPSTSTAAILDHPYNTAVNGNLYACNLYINDDGLGGYHTLTIADGTYVEVENDLIVNGKIIVNPKGAFIQNNDLGTVTVANKTSITVEKKTAPMDAWYEYTYWSSPVSGEIIDLGLSDAQANRRFWFNAKNFRDSKKEIGNNNTFVNNQQDDIDDDGNDWTLASGSDIMTPGVGYASTHSKSLFFGPPMSSPPYQFVYTFEGPFNNGTITVPIYRNDDETNDNNWNLIGNPYPSAISADIFLAENVNEILEDVPVSPPIGGFSEGALFLWSQDTSPSNTNSGNENENFAQSDYAIINMSSETAGGDGVKPNRFIPSGQSFFIVYDNAAAGTQISSSPNIKEGYVVFKNNMRMADVTSNSQFFRTLGANSAKSKKLPNKLWINLISDNGVFNQIAVGYVDKATDGDDGMGYDTPRNLSNQLYSSIYTLIDGIDKKLAIQGKSPESLTLDEKIILGFDTSINIATLYTLSIDRLEGDFLSANTMYLRDNLMNITHNLSASGYTFTSDVGEFKDRFELVLKTETLSDTEFQLNVNKLTIIELENDLVQFKTNSDKDIQSVKIMDLLGRTLYLFEGSSAVETYNLSQLSQSAYLAEVKLSNGQIITKRAIKRK